ncbi:MAG: nucleotidyltransferase family protein [Deltaproteobacteria bacterium]|nr:nucleotidyltransferase family protein [Deltaproteobacteria bacterium]MBW2018613.1 nucleotidyltransferase family protein [Deltaproteobacteria bacterium]MBW2073879.1 nucleotidyltransferase family protein [Deltaproteobacteria bacterium]
MKDWKKTLVSQDTPIIEALKIIDAASLQIALVVDEQRHLLGTVTDGDVRAGILRGVSLQEPVEKVMWKRPIVARSDDDPEAVLNLMKREDILQIPLVDEEGRVVGMKILKELIRTPARENSVVVMAGGLGTRLRPVTNDFPKPLLKVGNKPILEIILENFIEYGFHSFYFSVNYMAELIEKHFGDGSRWGVQIEYLREKKRMGTAGALSLLQERPKEPLFVMNGDLLTKVNFLQLLEFHEEHKAKGTMCVREYDLQVPYGVVQTEKHRLVSIDEKPVHRFFVNAGIYVLDPVVLEYIPENSFFDMTSVFQKLVEEGEETAVFPIREYWLDIGRMDDFKRANGEYSEHFIPPSEK